MKIAVLEKCFTLLESMADFDRPMSLKDLAAATHFPKATVYRLLQTLLDLGYVEQDRSRSNYQITMQLAQLGRGYSFQGLKERALPWMEAIHQRFDETVNLGVLQGAYVYYVHFIETTQNLQVQVNPSARDPFYSTALGRAIVSYLPAAQQEGLLARAVLKTQTAFTVTRISVLRAILAETRSRGWAFDDQENDVGVVCIGVPILEAGRPIASISVSVPKARLPLERQQEIVGALLGLSDPGGSVQRHRKAYAIP